MRKIGLISNWKSSYKWLSMHCMFLATAIQGAWMYVPDDLKEQVPHNMVYILTMAILLLGLAGRLLKQGDNGVGAS